jgi:hypothetical protein
VKKFLLFLICFTIVSCSRINFGIRYIEYAISKDIATLFEFSGTKKQNANRGFEKIALSAKRKMLPQIAKRLLELKESVDINRFQKDISADLERIRPDIEEFANEMVDQIGTEEYAHVLKKYEEKITVEREELKNHLKRKNEIKQRVYTGLNYFLGSLTEQQKNKAEDFFQIESYPFELQLENRLNYLEVLRQSKGQRDKLKLLANKYTQFPSPLELQSYQKSREIYFIKFSNMISEVLGSMSVKQKQNFDQSLTSLSQDLQELALD